MAGQVVNSVVTEVTAETEGLRTQLAVAEGYIKRLQDQTKSVGTVGAQAGDKYAAAFRGAASAAETLARTGKLSGEAAKSALTQVSSSLAMFLPGGPFIAGLGIATLAVIQSMGRIKQEARDTAEEVKRIKDDIERSRQGGDQSALIDRARTADTNLKEQRAELAELNKQLEAADRVLKNALTIDTGIPALTVLAAKAGLSEEAKARLARRKEIEATIPLLEKELELATKAALNVRDQSGRAPRGITPIRVTTTAPARVASDAVSEAAVMRELQQGFDDLFAKAQIGSLQIAEFDKTVRDLGDSFRDKLKTPTDAQTSAFETLSAKASEVRRQLGDLKADQAAETFNKLFASMTTTAVDDLQVGLEELRQQFAKGLLPKEREAELIGAQASFIESTFAVEQAGRAMEDARFRGLEYAETLNQIHEFQTRLNATAGKSEAFDRERVLLLEKIKELTAKLPKLREDEARGAAITAVATADTAKALGNAARAAFGLASGLLGAEHAVTRLLGGTLQLVAGLQEVNDLASKAGGLGKLFGSGAGALSALPGIGQAIGGGLALLSAIKGLFGEKPEDPEARRRAEILEENNKRLADLRDTLGEVIRVSVSGRDIANVRRETFTRQGIDLGVGPPLAGGGGFTTRAASAAEVLASLRQAGTSLKELQQIADDFGITLSDSPTIEELKQLQEAVNNFSLKRMLESFQGAKELLEAEFDIFDIEDPIEQAKRFKDLISRMSPAFQEAMAGIDLATREGREAASRVIEEFFKKATQSGQLSADEIEALFGDMLPDEAIAAWRELEAAIEEATIAARAFANLRESFEVFGTSLVEQGELFLEAAKNQFPDVFGDLDFADPEGIRQAYQDFFRTAIADGIIDESERVILDAFKFIFGAARQIADDARARALSRADRDIAIRDIDDPIARFGVKADALERAFPGMKEFMDQFDLSTVEGIEAFSAALPDFIAGIEDGSIVIEGLAQEDIPGFVSALYDIETAGDAAEQAVRSFADSLTEAFADIDLDAAIFGESAQDTFNKKFSRIIAGLPAPPGTGGFTPGGSFDLSTQAGRDEARKALRALAVSNPELKPLIVDLLRDIDSLPELIGDAVGEAVGGAGGGGGTMHSGTLQQLTLYQGDRLITLAETQLLHLRAIDENTRRAISAATAPVSPIVAPSIPGFGASFANGGGAQRPSVQIGPIIVQVPAGTENPQAFGQAVGRATLNEILADEMIRERFFSGSGQVI